MLGRVYLLGAGVCALMFEGCASTAALEVEVSRLRREQHALTQALQETKLALERLDSRVTMLSLGERVESAPKTPVARANAASADDAPRKPAEKVLPVVRLAGQARPSAGQGDDWVDPGAVDDGGPPVVLKLAPGATDDGGERLPVDREVLKKPDPVLGQKPPKAESATEVARRHERALSLLRERNRPAEALPLFEELLAAHPSSSVAADAAYWVGECHSRLGASARALAAFQSQLERYPNSARTPDALLGIAEAQLALGRTLEGSASLNQLIDLFPATEAARSARVRLVEPHGGVN